MLEFQCLEFPSQRFLRLLPRLRVDRGLLMLLLLVPEFGGQFADSPLCVRRDLLLRRRWRALRWLILLRQLSRFQRRLLTYQLLGLLGSWRGSGLQCLRGNLLLLRTLLLLECHSLIATLWR